MFLLGCRVLPLPYGIFSFSGNDQKQTSTCSRHSALYGERLRGSIHRNNLQILYRHASRTKMSGHPLTFTHGTLALRRNGTWHAQLVFLIVVRRTARKM